jgi:hypothetical protein
VLDAAGLLSDDDDTTEVYDTVNLLPDVLWVLKAQIWPLPTTRGDTTSGGTLTTI